MTVLHPWLQYGRSGMTRVLLAAFAATMAFIAHAAPVDEDLPGRVGRVAEVGGELFLASPDRAGDWSSIGLNYPVTTGDDLWVADQGRAEIDFGGGQFRLAGETNLHVSRLDDRQLALFLAHGRVIVRLRVLDLGEVATVDTPNTQVQFTRTGLYRVEFDKDRVSTTVIVREGEAVVAIAGGAQQILPGQIGTLAGADPGAVAVSSGVGIDGFDSWSANRDRHYERGRSTSYVSRQMVGWSDLDEHGVWDSHPTYGAVWYPTTVAADWAPYRHGRWVWAGNWGWAWVDDAPWGYAPFHYGRWVWNAGRWGWCPGVWVARPVWAPALVGWYGGDRWNAAVNFGGPVFGWVPLGWGDPFIPSWGGGGCGGRCWTHYNRPYAVNRAERPNAPPTHYANSRIPGAITAVAGATMTGSRPVAPNLVPVPAPAAGVHQAMARAPALKPLRLPDLRPGPGAPPPASTFYPTTKPRLATTPPQARGSELPAAANRAVVPAPDVRPLPPTRPQDSPAPAAGTSRNAKPMPATPRPAAVAPAGPQQGLPVENLRTVAPQPLSRPLPPASSMPRTAPLPPAAPPVTTGDRHLAPPASSIPRTAPLPPIAPPVTPGDRHLAPPVSVPPPGKLQEVPADRPRHPAVGAGSPPR